MRIGIVAPPWVQVPPPRYGGTEAVIDTLARGLQAAGHDVTLFATGDSSCPVNRRWVYPRALGTETAADHEVWHVSCAYRYLAGRVDVIHDNTLVGPARLLDLAAGTPVVNTNHGPFVPQILDDYEQLSRRVPVIAISNAQAASAPSVRIAAVIHHGIEFDRVPLGKGDGGYVAFLGRMTAEKGPDRAIRAAQAAGLPIRLAAKMWEPAERTYYHANVKPLLGADATYIGEIDAREKAALLAGARALLNPIRWPEPFGLAMIEAMAAGTPVLAFREGSAPELIDGGVTGFLCDDEQAMARAISLAVPIDRVRCRAVAQARFSATRMVDAHVRLYNNVIARTNAGRSGLRTHATPPAAGATRRVGSTSPTATLGRRRGQADRTNQDGDPRVAIRSAECRSR